MLILSEDDVRTLVSPEEAVVAVEEVFAAYDRRKAFPYPVIRESVHGSSAVFGVKSGFDSTAGTLGLKAGGYWPNNTTRDLGNHQSSILLLDPETGRAEAVVSANYLTAIRTGAAGALAVKYLSRDNARTLGVIGAGVQASFQLRATAAVRHLERVIAWAPSTEKLASFGQAVKELGLEFIAAERANVVRESDIVVTVTPSTSSLIDRQWVRPGTHINAMGADTIGKQELDTTLPGAAAVFVDSVEQAVTIGECQHAYIAGLFRKEDVQGTLGGLITGRSVAPGSPSKITLFDGTGIALQDLTVAALACKLAEERGMGHHVTF